MKNETARREIESLDYYLQNHTDDYSEESHTAMMMAIKALEAQESSSEKPNNCAMRDATLEERESIDKYIKSISKPTGVKFGALEQEPTVTSTNNSGEMTYPQVEGITPTVALPDVDKDFQIGDEVRTIGSDPIYDDCDVGWVIRNASERVKTMYVMRNDGSADEENKAEWYKTGRHNAMLAEVIKQLPSVKPQEPKTGYWITHPKGIYAHLICDKCLSNAPYDCRTDYCPSCGCRMVEPQESEG